MYDCKFQERLYISRESTPIQFFNEFIQHKEWPLSMDNANGAHGFSGHRIVCLDIVQGVSGQCPHFPLRESMDNVQKVHGHSPGRWWTIPNEFMEIGQSECAPWTLSRVSMNIVQAFH